ncbi:MAG TPA: hypothetical protein VHP11_06745 [Tepidisphaeraceae bacterium]|nr:hypothetical protein [Tepidisphaeraceae bacterium]
MGANRLAATITRLHSGQPLMFNGMAFTMPKERPTEAEKQARRRARWRRYYWHQQRKRHRAHTGHKR